MPMFTIKECAREILAKENIIILIHSNPDGDCVGSGAAMTAILTQLSKNVRLVCPHALPERLAFVCEGIPEECLCFAKEVEEDFKADLIMSVDVASIELLGKNQPIYGEKIDICIDHHMINTVPCDKILRNPSASACGEIILELCDEMSLDTGKTLLSQQVANMLYAAISSDCGSFKYGNTTAKTLLYASRLKSVGANTERISKLLFDTRSLSQYKLMGYLIPKTEFINDGKIAYCLLLDEELALCGATKEDIDGVSQMFREVRGVEISIFAKQYTDSETGENRLKMSLRANRDVNVAKICECFGGGGHIKAAGCTIKNETNENARKLIIEKATELFPELK